MFPPSLSSPWDAVDAGLVPDDLDTIEQ